MCDARRMGAHPPPCRFKLDCSGADGRGATGEEQPLRAKGCDERWLNHPGDHRQIKNRQRRWSEKAAPKTGGERVKGETAMVVWSRWSGGSRAFGSRADLQPTRGLCGEAERMCGREFAIGDELRLRHRVKVQMVVRCLTAHEPAEPRHHRGQHGSREAVPRGACGRFGMACHWP